MKNLFTDEHLDNLPTIRLAKIALKNFKSVKNGEIVLNCGKKYIPYGTKPDILGLYGQNGSGKTALIEAISILKHLLSGRSVPCEYADCIDVESGFSTLSFTFDFQYPEGNNYPTNNDIRNVVYSFKIKRDVVSDDVAEDFAPMFVIESDDEEFSYSAPKEQVIVYDEVLKVSGTMCGKKCTLKPFCDTSKPDIYIAPATKAKHLLGDLDESKRIQLGIAKEKAKSKSKSFIFIRNTLDLFNQYSNYSIFYQILVELYMWAHFYLFVVDSKSTGLIRLNFMLPVFANGKMQVVPIGKRFPVRPEAFEDMKKNFASISLVLTQIVPGLSIDVADYGTTMLKDGKTAQIVELIAKRGNLTIPLRSESDGVRKIISTLNLLILVYNQHSMTVAYDEFDAGIFEYLLGEILQVIQNSGKGQFIFTSHNMRPLEVLNKEFIWFTTTDPHMRYTKLAGLGETNNLRRVYYREIALHEHYDNLYSETKRNQIISAMRKAGGE